MEQQGLQGPRIALLIDFDNVILGVDEPPGFDVELVVNALRSRGVVVLGRAYGDWYRHNRHRRKLMEQGIELVETPAFGPIIKNSADIRIALDAFEIGMTQNHISHFCLVSGDSDFLPLVKRLQLLGKTIIVIAGNKFTSELIRRNCNEYISYENLLAESVGATEDATTLEGAYALLNRTVNTMNERGQEARSSAVKQMMLQLNPVFSERSFGCSQFKQFLNKACGAGIIRLGNRDGDSGEYHVRLIDDNGDSAEIPSAPPTQEKPLISDLETAPVRSRKSTSPAKSAPSAPEAEAATGDDGINLAEEIANNASTVSPARRGRLRFSGRTWRSGGTSTKTTEAADTNATDENVATAVPEETDSAPVATSEVNDAAEAKVSEAVADQKETSSKSTGRKSSKKTPAKEDKASEIPEAESKEIAESAAAETSGEEAAASEEEKPKKKAPARRRTSSRATTKTRTTKAKKTEGDAEAAPVATEEAPAKDTAAKAESSAEETAVDKETAKEEKPKKKAPARRRTSSRTTKKKEDEKATETPEPTEAKAD